MTSDADPQQGSRDRNWRIVVSAWGLVLFLVMMLAAVETTACRRSDSSSVGQFTGAVIPQHDPCVGPGIPSAANVDGCEGPQLSGDRYGYW